MKKSKLALFTQITLYLGLIGGLVFLVSLYWVLPEIFDIPQAELFGARYIILLLLWYAGVLAGLIILNILRVMMGTLNHNPFIMQNATRMRTMGLIALGMSGTILLMITLYFRAVFFILALITMLLALLALVLSDLFRRAVQMSDENRLTI